MKKIKVIEKFIINKLKKSSKLIKQANKLCKQINKDLTYYRVEKF